MFKITKISKPYCGDCSEILEADYSAVELAYEALRNFVHTEAELGHYDRPRIELDQHTGPRMDVLIKDGDVEKARFLIEFRQ